MVVAVESTLVTVRGATGQGKGGAPAARRRTPVWVCAARRVRFRTVTATTDPLAALADLPGAAESAAKARAAVDELRAHKVLRSRMPDVVAESALRGARASAALAGADRPLEELRRRSDLGTEEGSGLVRGALRVYGELDGLLAILGRAPAQALSRMHMLAAAGEVEADRIGRPRLPGEPVAAQPDGLAEAPPAGEAAARLTALTGLLLAPSRAPALVVAAIGCGELLAAAPFGWGDGLLARALFRLLLVERGLDPKSLSAPEVGFAELGALAGREALAGYATGTAPGVAAWIAHCAEASVLGAQESLAVCEALMRG
jgi:hypothetical protein